MQPVYAALPEEQGREDSASEALVMRLKRRGRPRSSALAALGATDEPLAFAHLARRQLVAAPGKGVRIGTEFDPHGRARQPERLAEVVLEVAPVGIRDVLRLVAVDDDDRRIASALVGVAQLDAPPADQRRLSTCGWVSGW